MMQIVFQAAAAIIALTAAVMAWRLERRLIRLRTGQDGMQTAAAALTEAVTRAEASVRALRDEGAETAAELERLIARARAASDELRLLSSAPVRRAAPAPAPQPAAAPASVRAASNVAPLRGPATWDLDAAGDEPVAPVRHMAAAPRPQASGESALMDRLRRVR